MTKIKDGGSAFPSGVEEVKYPENGGAITSIKLQPANKGMTLRDYFAAKALQAHITNNLNLRPEDVAKWAYRYADGMLAERERGE